MALSTLSNEQLAQKAQCGCLASFDELVRRFMVPLVHFLEQRAGNRVDAEDLTQETFVRAFRNLDRYSDSWRFSTWLFTIARRLSLNHRRQKRALGGAAEIETVVDSTPLPWQQASEIESRSQLWALAGRLLTEPEFTALWLHYVEEMPVQEIARVLGRSRVGVKTILFRARRKLLPALSESEETKRLSNV